MIVANVSGTTMRTAPTYPIRCTFVPFSFDASAQPERSLGVVVLPPGRRESILYTRYGWGRSAAMRSPGGNRSDPVGGDTEKDRSSLV
jgi:hypothetical protein